MKVGSLFAGIGGFDLGLERAGMRVAWQCEIDPDARAILAKHWPEVPCYGDIRSIDWSDVEPVDLICGGYPCQPFSHAGSRKGSDDPRHLWPEVARCVRELRPRWVLLENVSGHLSLGFGSVLGDLAALGYDAFWDCIPAAAIGAPHLRDRVFVVAWRVDTDADNPDRTDNRRESQTQNERRLYGRRRMGRGQYWRTIETPSAIRGVDNGVPSRLDTPRLRGLGNAIVPQIPEMIGRVIMEIEACT